MAESSEQAHVFVRSLSSGEMSTRERVEQATVWTAMAALLGACCLMVAYVGQFGEWLSPTGWLRLASRILTFAAVTGAACGVGISLGMASTRAASRPRWWHALGGGLGAIVPSAVAGAIGTAHFGSQDLPYAGGAGILGAISVGVLVAGVGFARSEMPSLRWSGALFAAVAPIPWVAVVVVPAALLAPEVVSLDLETMRVQAAQLGLPVLGSIGGVVVGAIGGTSLGLSTVLARRHQG